MPNFTQNAIKRSFIKLLEEYPLSQISVRMIVEECGINRKSFYYHFRDIPSLIGEITTEMVDELIKEYPEIDSLDECINVAFRFLRENKRAILHIYNSVSRDVYDKSIMDLCEYIVKTYFEKEDGWENVTERDRQAIILFFKSTIYGLLFEWIDSGMKDEFADLSKRITELCRGFSEELIHRSNKIL